MFLWEEDFPMWEYLKNITGEIFMLHVPMEISHEIASGMCELGILLGYVVHKGFVKYAHLWPDEG